MFHGAKMFRKVVLVVRVDTHIAMDAGVVEIVSANISAPAHGN